MLLLQKFQKEEVTLHYALENENQYSSTVTIDPKQIEENEAVPSIVSRIVIAKEIESLDAKQPAGGYFYDRGDGDYNSAEDKEIIGLSIKIPTLQ